MAESATLLVDEVLPGQPMRQWVQASNLFAVIHYLQEQEGIHLEVKARKVA